MRDHVSFDNPLAALVQGGALAVITRVEGSSYRDPGTMMAVLSTGLCVGNLTGGCIEADVALHARSVMEDGQRRALRYGEGSPFADLVLPCGGALEITILPAPEPSVLADAEQRRTRRIAFSLMIRPEGICLAELQTPGWQGDTFVVEIRPEIRFAVFGHGTEATVFARIAQAAGYDAVLSPEMKFIDAHTAVTLFFHDHDRELPLLLDILKTDAFYVGAQGSLRAAHARSDELRHAGADEVDIARIHGPIGLIQRARDSRVLAISVMAEVLAAFHSRPRLPSHQ